MVIFETKLDQTKWTFRHGDIKSKIESFLFRIIKKIFIFIDLKGIYIECLWWVSFKWNQSNKENRKKLFLFFKFNFLILNQKIKKTKNFLDENDPKQTENDIHLKQAMERAESNIYFIKTQTNEMKRFLKEN